ncbi:alpha-1,2-fucosyltransferase [Roseicyclus sp. F158]|uniref:Alpha-1,2-fucosyltransferase n=1 Tax=Tropicimonas omnivorans TaxID=3075590 RepID=A0ABU3DC52_9RHOB|nr:alpha-1,2-fucosyltransferase [Roseicyclus sp. F158]MDT0681292.1 alpha-1,2-fucosyltransferase [Roseicyclus sp. F158]
MAEARIVAQISFGLGNQLLQFGAAYAIARRLGVPLDLDLSWFGATHGDKTTARAEELTALVPDHLYRNLCRQGRWTTVTDGLRKGLTGRETRFGLPVWDAYWSRTEDAATLAAPLYIKDISFDTRLMAPALPDILPAVRARLAARYRAPEGRYAFLHVRRGDYLSKKFARKFRLLGPDWYGAAMSAYEEANGKARWILCSDDPPAALETMPEGFSIETSPATSTLEDLALMAGASGGVTANSTFSLWGGLLSGGAVVAPGEWRVDGRASPVLPEHWTLL